MEIQYYIKDVYGKQCLYLKNPTGKKEQAILKLLNQKTITDEQIRLFSELGIIFNQVMR